MSKISYPVKQVMVAASVCQIANDTKAFEILIAYADGREIETFADRSALTDLRDNINKCLEHAK